MFYWFVFCCVLVLVNAVPNDNEVSDECIQLQCVGDEYECINGQCFCADGYIPNHFQSRCVRCPGLGEKCFGPCCNRLDRFGNGTLQCWQGICKPCYDLYGNWICREPLDQIFLISSTQIIMGTALIMGIIATFILLYKLCAATTLRPIPHRSTSGGRLSIGSLQLYVEERLRDAPPGYSRTPLSSVSTYPPAIYLNAGFLHDSSVPPPPYTPEIKADDNQHNTIHI